MRFHLPLLAPLLLLLVAPDTPRCAAPDADEVIDLFMAPCCFRGTLKDHHSSEANEMKAEIRDMVSGGRTQDEIRTEFVARYGEQILAEPPQEGINRLAFAAPVAAILAGGIAVFTVLRRNRTPSPPPRETRPSPGDGEGGDDELEKLIREED